MSDIVERLRERKEPTIEVDIHYPQIVCSDVPDDECIEAADEIERLTAEVKRLKAVEADYDDHEREMIDLEEDNARLRAEVSELNSVFDARWSADMRAIERWRKENPGNELALPDHVDLSLWLMDERTRLRAGNAKLRAALERAAHELELLYIFAISNGIAEANIPPHVQARAALTQETT